jgi:hypothetical protein
MLICGAPTSIAKSPERPAKPFLADDAGLDERAVLEPDHQGRHATVGEIAVLDGLAHLIENFPRGQINRLEVLPQALVAVLRQR